METRGTGVAIASLGALTALNAYLVFVFPDGLGYPGGGHFLLTWLPILCVACFLRGGAAVVLAALPRTPAMSLTVLAAGLVALAVGNGWLFMQCVASV